MRTPEDTQPNPTEFCENSKIQKKTWFEREETMMMRFFMLAFICFAGPLFGDSPKSPFDYMQKNLAGKSVLVMLAPEWERSKDESIRKTYTKAGLYTDDQAKSLLWALEFYAMEISVSSDNRHLVRWGPWADKGNFNEMALEFYDQGKLLKKYVVKDLVKDCSKLPESKSHYRWRENFKFNDSLQRLTVFTYDGMKHVFDVSSGQLLESTVAEPVTPSTNEIPLNPSHE